MTLTLRDGSTTDDPRLDLIRWPAAVDLDRYNVIELAEQTPPDSSAHEWRSGPVLDQQAEGACVLHALIADAMGSPRRLYPLDPAAAQVDAFEYYWRAQEIDEWPETQRGGAGGTSLEAGARICIEEGHFSEYRWADSIDSMLAAMLRGRAAGDDVFGPCVIAVEWLDGMYETGPDGVVHPSGPAVGWHAIWVRGAYLALPGFSEPVFKWRNSWGESYGLSGDAFITASDMQARLGPQPEIMFPIGRARRRGDKIRS